MRDLRVLARYLAPCRRDFAAAVALLLAECCLEMAIPLLMSRAIDGGVAAGDAAFLCRQGVLMALCAGLALAAGFLFRRLRPRESASPLPALLASGAVGEAVMAAGYFLYEAAPFPVGLGPWPTSPLIWSRGCSAWPPPLPPRWLSAAPASRSIFEFPPYPASAPSAAPFWVRRRRSLLPQTPLFPADSIKKPAKPRRTMLFRCFLQGIGVN